MLVQLIYLSKKKFPFSWCTINGRWRKSLKPIYLCMHVCIHPSRYKYGYFGFCGFVSPVPFFHKIYSFSFSCPVDCWRPHIQVPTVNWLSFRFKENPWCEPGEQKEERRHSIFVSLSLYLGCISSSNIINSGSLDPEKPVSQVILNSGLYGITCSLWSSSVRG